ncbi:hypothetical protein OsJ_26657 [Oryza sativa Japonica Group]|uniref:Uncharacterized protein n=1 Tax=Oryza sativa subsp. japonica TaxID=39947 RepID=B9FZY7_ORYSJ|nr:hypothetical protein OsJ_26657 [Oryza sativa Japonica Group]
MEHPVRRGEPPLRADVEPSHRLPPGRRHGVPDQAHLHDGVHGGGGLTRAAMSGPRGQVARVDAEHRHGRHVEHEPPGKILHIERRPGGRHAGQEGENTIPHLVEAGGGHGGNQPWVAEDAQHLGTQPEVGLAVEGEGDAGHDVEDLGELVALGVVAMVGGEDVPDIFRVTCDEEPDAAGRRRAARHDGVSRRGEDAGEVVVEVV